MPPDIERALARFAEEQGVTRDEALSVIARDWLIGMGYLAYEPDAIDDEADFSESGVTPGNP